MIVTVGHRCMPCGRLPDPSHIDKIIKWGPCRDLLEVHTFLGTIGVCHIFIASFAKCANVLVHLTCKDVPFKFGPVPVAAQADLKEALLNLPALQPINYNSDSLVILAVDTSQTSVAFYLCQADLHMPKKWYFARFGSLPLNDHERQFSQLKLELYGLYHALHTYKMFLVGIRNLIVEVNARYMKGMLNNPNIAPLASVNQWIVSILTFTSSSNLYQARAMDLMAFHGDHHSLTTIATTMKATKKPKNMRTGSTTSTASRT
jgi:hypothetical protein